MPTITIGWLGDSTTAVFGPGCGGSIVWISGGSGRAGSGPKYRSAMRRASAGFTSPTIAIVMFAGT